MTEQTPEPTEISYPDTIGADLHERGSLDFVLDEALRNAAVLGTGWIRIRFRKTEGDVVPQLEHDRDEAELTIGDWTLDAPDPAQIIEVVTVIAGTEPGSLEHAQRVAEAAGDLYQETEEETR